jgi:hypothetical protein
MACKLYMDQHVPRAITAGLRMRQIDVLTAYEDGTSELTDPQLLDRATILGRLLFSQDVDLLAVARRRQAEGISFGGVIYAATAACLGRAMCRGSGNPHGNRHDGRLQR